MKKVLLVIFIFVLTGCDITYNLEIDENYIENTSIIDNNYNSWNQEYSGMTLSQYNDYYLTKEIPYHYDDPYMPEAYYRFEGVSYYEAKELSNDSQIGLSLNANFENIDSYSKSNIIWKSCRNKSIHKTDDNISISASGFKSFDEFPVIDKITVNIKSTYYSTSNNADSMENGVYTWIITKDNYKDKNINITFKTSNIVDDAIKEAKTSPMIKFGIVLLVICIIGSIVYLFTKKRYNQNNSL